MSPVFPHMTASADMGTAITGNAPSRVSPLRALVVFGTYRQGSLPRAVIIMFCTVASRISHHASLMSTCYASGSTKPCENHACTSRIVQRFFDMVSSALVRRTGRGAWSRCPLWKVGRGRDRVLLPIRRVLQYGSIEWKLLGMTRVSLACGGRRLMGSVRAIALVMPHAMQILAGNLADARLMLLPRRDLLL